MKRILGLLFLSLLFLAGLSAQSKPAPVQAGARLNIAELQRPVTILRDRWGVAHIYAQNQHDLFVAQGFNAASDRIFQMEMWKRSGQGRLSEVLGRGSL